MSSSPTGCCAVQECPGVSRSVQEWDVCLQWAGWEKSHYGLGWEGGEESTCGVVGEGWGELADGEVPVRQGGGGGRTGRWPGLPTPSPHLHCQPAV